MKKILLLILTFNFINLKGEDTLLHLYKGNKLNIDDKKEIEDRLKKMKNENKTIVEFITDWEIHGLTLIDSDSKYLKLNKNKKTIDSVKVYLDYNLLTVNHIGTYDVKYSESADLPKGEIVIAKIKDKDIYTYFDFVASASLLSSMSDDDFLNLELKISEKCTSIDIKEETEDLFLKKYNSLIPGRIKEILYLLENRGNKPYIGDPLINMKIVGTNAYPSEGGDFGCVRNVNKTCESKTKNLVVQPSKKPRIQYHGGVDLYAPIGEKLYSMYDGVVVNVKLLYNVDEATGKTITVKYLPTQHKKSDKTIYAVYMHLQTISVNVNDKLKAGDLIGTSGDTGNAVGIPEWREHLHLTIYEGVWSNNNAVDPVPYLGTTNIEKKIN